MWKNVYFDRDTVELTIQLNCNSKTTLPEVFKAIRAIPPADVMPKTTGAAVNFLLENGWLKSHDKELIEEVIGHVE